MARKILTIAMHVNCRLSYLRFRLFGPRGSPTLQKMEEGLSEAEVAQFRWWAWAAQYKTSKVRPTAETHETWNMKPRVSPFWSQVSVHTVEVHVHCS